MLPDRECRSKTVSPREPGPVSRPEIPAPAGDRTFDPLRGSSGSCICFLRRHPHRITPKASGPDLSQVVASPSRKTVSCECSSNLGRNPRRGITGVISAHHLRIRYSGLHDRSPGWPVPAHRTTMYPYMRCRTLAASTASCAVPRTGIVRPPCLVADAGYGPAPSGPGTGLSDAQGGAASVSGRREQRGRLMCGRAARRIPIPRRKQGRARKRSVSRRCLEACMRSGRVRVESHGTGLTLFGCHGAG